SRLAELAARTGTRGVIVAIAQSDAAFLRECRDRLAGTGVWLRTIPTIGELVTRGVGLDDVRNLRVEDLIGRSPVRTDLTEIAQAIRGKRVLVTGAGGSIGGELCRQLHALAPETLVMLDRDETALHGVELSIRGSALLTSQDTVLADIRDAEALKALFAEARPDIVFHAAALKHLPMLQRFPLEGWKTNVHGTLNVLAAAQNAGVSTFVNISTDKAAAPTSELGRSKRMGERLVAEYARSQPGTFLSVRFGNVLGSRGSVLQSFREQLRAGGPLTVTDPDVTRYFMTIPEACQLVLQAAAIGEDGCVMVLDMGEPVRIVDLAKNLIALADADADIVFTGLRPGEKLDEELFGDYESDDVHVRDRISRVRVPALEVGRLPSPEAPLTTVVRFVDEACDHRTAEIPVLSAPQSETPGAEAPPADEALATPKPETEVLETRLPEVPEVPETRLPGVPETRLPETHLPEVPAPPAAHAFASPAAPAPASPVPAAPAPEAPVPAADAPVPTAEVAASDAPTLLAPPALTLKGAAEHVA
ncbi:MAG TPA: polysaccharide biosynthesis protein, partial [Brevibacterium sp.]|nr:polysaccharide biosynthesis protein [Brevibacterium sp.]